jgi:hypothetical protein
LRKKRGDQIGRFFAYWVTFLFSAVWGKLLKGLTFVGTFSAVKMSILPKIELGYILGDFFANSSGQPSKK